MVPQTRKSINKSKQTYQSKNQATVPDVLYLHNQNLFQIPLLYPKFSHVTKLFLQNNRIAAPEGLYMLTCLETLDLSYNNISIINGLEHSHCLKELSIHRQFITHSQMVRFDPRTIETLKNNLIILNCAGNNLEELGQIGKLINIESLDLSNNQIENLSKLNKDLLQLPNLKCLNLTNNKVCRQKNYIRNILGAGGDDGPNIEELDKRSVLPQLKQHCIARYRMSAQRIRHKSIFGDISARCDSLATGIKEGLQQYVMKDNKLILLMNADRIS